MLYGAKEKEPDSSSMDIETQSFSPVFILDPPSEKDKSLKLETNQATRENQFNKGGDSSSMDIEPPSFSAIFPLTASQETAFKPETNQLINDVHHLLRSSTPIPDDLNKPLIKVCLKEHFYFLKIDFHLYLFLIEKYYSQIGSGGGEENGE